MSKYNKYHAQKVEFDGKRFDSRREARRYAELRLLERAGEITGLRTQVPFELIPGTGRRAPVPLCRRLRVQRSAYRGNCRRGRQGRADAGVCHQAQADALAVRRTADRNLRRKDARAYEKSTKGKALQILLRIVLHRRHLPYSESRGIRGTRVSDAEKLRRLLPIRRLRGLLF